MPKAPEPLTVLGLEAAARKAKRTGKRAELRDATTRGLLARVQSDGSVSFALRYVDRKTKVRERYFLGAWKATRAASGLTLEAARTEAVKRLAEGNPKAEAAKRAAKAAEERLRKGRTVERVAEAWLVSTEAKAWRPSTRREFERVVRREIIPSLGHLDPNSPEARMEAAALVKRIAEGKPQTAATKHAAKRGRRPKRSEPAPVMANRVLAILRCLYRWTLLEDQKGLGVTVDATAGLKRPHIEDAAPRPYTGEELRALFTAAQGIDELRELVPLLAYTMTRLSEARGARWSEINFAEKVWTIGAERSKDGRPHILPLTDAALELLQGIRDARKVVTLGEEDAVFPGRALEITSRVRALWRASSGVADAAFHAFRDTAADALRELAFGPDVREDLLSHTPSKLHRAYQGEYRVSLAERRRALEAWGDHLNKILAEGARPTRVMPVR